MHESRSNLHTECLPIQFFLITPLVITTYPPPPSYRRQNNAEDKTDTDKLIVEDEDGDVEVLRLEYEGTPEEMEDPVAPEQEDIAKTEEERAEDDVVPHEGTPVMDEDSKDIIGKLMELTSPLNSSSEKMEDEERTSKEEEDGAKTDEVTVAEAKDEGRSIGRLDSEMESSYSLDAEVLLYEGDVENEPEQSFDKKDDYLLDDEGNEYGLIVNLHDDSMDIDVAPKVQPKAGVKKGSLPEARSRKDQLQQSGGDTRRKQPSDAAEPPRFVSAVSSFSPQVHTYQLSRHTAIALGSQSAPRPSAWCL